MNLRLLKADGSIHLENAAGLHFSATKRAVASSAPAHPLEPPADQIRVALQAQQDIAPQAVDLAHLGELLRAVLHHLARLEATVKEQVGHSPLAYRGQQILDALPQLTTLLLVCHQRLSQPSRLRQRQLSGALVAAH